MIRRGNAVDICYVSFRPWEQVEVYVMYNIVSLLLNIVLFSFSVILCANASTLSIVDICMIAWPIKALK